MKKQLKPYLRRLRRDFRKILRQEPWIFPEGTRERIRLGSGYGGWWLHPSVVTAESVVYSAGVGFDISFDLALIELFGVVVHAFDPTPASIAWVQNQLVPHQFVMHDFGVADRDGIAQFLAPKKATHISHSLIHQAHVGQDYINVQVLCLQTIMERLNHTRIDLLKMDIEGAEYDVLENIVSSQIPIRQLLVEFHHRFIPRGVARTEAAVRRLRQGGFELFAISDNGDEYSFVRP